ncbi:hypothetical protein [Polaribacter sp.]|uniref:hypothetical protein n=1 Tax=Polaribacter sp. TaxID=1920175 RepID=UPI004048092F
MKTYNHTNFFKHTYCEFHVVENFEFPTDSHFKSNSNSLYFYTKEGVFRKSNHWGRVANSHWKIIGNQQTKNQQNITGFASWDAFFPTNSSEKNFVIVVDFEQNSASLASKKNSNNAPLFSFLEAQQKLKKIRELLQNDAWTNYFSQDTKEIKQLVIDEFLNTSKSLQQIKQTFI